MVGNWDVPNRNLQRLKAIPKLAGMYASVSKIKNAVDLTEVPPMTEADYLIAMAEPKRWDCGRGAFAFMSSGRPVSPRLVSSPPTSTFQRSWPNGSPSSESEDASSWIFQPEDARAQPISSFGR